MMVIEQNESLYREKGLSVYWVGLFIIHVWGSNWNELFALLFATAPNGYQ